MIICGVPGSGGSPWFSTIALDRLPVDCLVDGSVTLRLHMYMRACDRFCIACVQAGNVVEAP